MQVVRKSKVGVSDGALKFGVASMGLACLINPDRSVDKVEVILPPIPNTPIEEFMRENFGLMKEMKAAMKRTQLQLSMLWQAKVKGDKEEFAKLLNVENEEEEEEEDDMDNLTPPFPILQMGLDQLPSYFAKLMKRLLEMQGENGRLWAGPGKPAGKKTTNLVICLHISSPIYYICQLCQLQAELTCTMRGQRAYSPEMATKAGARGASGLQGS